MVVGEIHLTEDADRKSRILTLDLSDFKEEIITFKDLSKEEILQVEQDFRDLFETESIMCFTNLSNPGETKTRFEICVKDEFWVWYAEKESFCWSTKYQKLLGYV